MKSLLNQSEKAFNVIEKAHPKPILKADILKAYPKEKNLDQTLSHLKTKGKIKRVPEGFILAKNTESKTAKPKKRKNNKNKNKIPDNTPQIGSVLNKLIKSGRGGFVVFVNPE